MKVLSFILFVIYGGLIAALLLLQPKKPAEPEDPEEMEAKIVVVDEDTDEPIEGAKIKIKTNDESCPELTLVTDENGECTFTYTDSEAQITFLRATKAGYEPEVLEEDYDLNEFEDGELTIQMKKQDMNTRAQQIGASGALKITLMWDDPSIDLDLHVVEPNGFEISYLDGNGPNGHMRDRDTGGTLDVDWTPTNGNPDNIGENVVWQTSPLGTYQARVHYFGPEETGPVECTVIVYQENQPDQTYTITLNGKDDSQDIPAIVVQ